MIYKALQFTSNLIDQFLKNTFSLDESKVVLNNLIDSDGSIPKNNQNKVVLSLINIEKETTRAFNTRNHQLGNGSYVNLNPEERFNVDILLSANFDDYSEALKFINAIIIFFQVNTSLSASNSSVIPKGINKLEFDIEKLNYQQMHSLWTAMGAKYQPSVIYKMRLLTLQGFESNGFAASVSAIPSQVVQ